MTKRAKKIIISLLVIFVACTIFTKISLFIFDKLPENYTKAVYTDYVCRNYGAFDTMAEGDSVIYIELLNEEKGANLKIQHFINFAWGNDTDDHREVHITDFEKCLLFDYALLVFRFDKQESEPPDVSGRMSLAITPYGSSPLWLDGHVLHSYTAGTPAMNLFILAELTMVYLRNDLLFIMLIFSFPALLVYLASKRYFEGKSLTFGDKCSYLRKLASRQLDFLLFSVVITGFISLVFTHLTYYREHYAWEQCWESEAVLYFGTGVKAGTALAAVQAVLLLIFAEDKKFLRMLLFIIPSALMMQMHGLFFSYDCRYIKYFFEDRLLVYLDCFPFYPRLFNFVIFFLPAFPLYFIFCRAVDKSLRRSLAWAMSQAAANAFLTCLAAYVVQLSVRMWGVPI